MLWLSYYSATTSLSSVSDVLGKADMKYLSSIRGKMPDPQNLLKNRCQANGPLAFTFGRGLCS